MEQEKIAELLKILSLAHLLQAAVVVLAAWLLIRTLDFSLTRLARRFPRYRLQFTQGFPAMRLAIWLLAAAFIVLAILRPPDSVIYTLLGSIGLAVGLGAQDGIRNVVAGVAMIYNPPFRVGDMVHFGGHYGEVVSLDLSVTRLRTFNDDTVMVPNGEVLKAAVANSNSGELSELVAVPLDLPCEVALHEVMALAVEAARSSPFTYLKKPVAAVIEQRYEHGFFVRLTIKAYVIDVRLERLMASDITERMLDALQARGLFGAAPALPAP